METNVNILNEISVKLGGESGASSVVEALNNIANALGDTDPDVIRTVNDSLNDILEYAGGGGGSSYSNPILTIKYVNGTGSSINISGYQTAGYIFNNTVLGGGLNEPVIEIASGENATFEVIVLLTNDPNEPFATTIPFSLDVNSIAASDEVNCTYDEGWVIITDPTSNASITVTGS